MDNKTLLLMNKIIKILSKKDYDLTLPSIYTKEVNICKVSEYIRYEILKNFSKNELNELKRKIFNINDNYSESGILIKNNSISKVLIPTLNNVLSSMIIIHELTHYIAYKNKLSSFTYLSLYDELAPINSEYTFLLEFYKDYLNEHENYRFNEAIKMSHKLYNKSSNGSIEKIDEKKNNINEIINLLSHIYSILLLKQKNNYQENKILFDEINTSPNPLESKYIENNIYLNKKIIKELKK